MGTILLIEKNIDILGNLAEGFYMEGYKVLMTQNGDEGIGLAEEFIPDLIISAILIGKMDGYEVLSQLKNGKKTSEIPFIFSTTKCEKNDIRKGLSLGADDYIVKPYYLETVFEIVKMRLISKKKVHTVNH